jgi:hypothetical protein
VLLGWRQLTMTDRIGGIQEADTHSKGVEESAGLATANDATFSSGPKNAFSRVRSGFPHADPLISPTRLREDPANMKSSSCSHRTQRPRYRPPTSRKHLNPHSKNVNPKPLLSKLGFAQPDLDSIQTPRSRRLGRGSFSDLPCLPHPRRTAFRPELGQQ